MLSLTEPAVFFFMLPSDLTSPDNILVWLSYLGDEVYSWVRGVHRWRFVPTFVQVRFDTETRATRVQMQNRVVLLSCLVHKLGLTVYKLVHWYRFFFVFFSQLLTICYHLVQLIIEYLFLASCIVSLYTDDYQSRNFDNSPYSDRKRKRKRQKDNETNGRNEVI